MSFVIVILLLLSCIQLCFGVVKRVEWKWRMDKRCVHKRYFQVGPVGYNHHATRISFNIGWQ